MRSLALSLALALPGCLLIHPPSAHMTGADAGPAPVDGGGVLPVPATRFCSEMARVACTGYTECCDEDPPALTMEECVMAIQRECANGLGPIILDPRTGYSETVAGEVLLEGEALVTGCNQDIVRWYSSRTGLQRVLQGTYGGGEVCSMSATDVPAYFSCRDLSQGCIGSGTTFNCTARRTMGMPCFVAPDCVETDYCMGGFPLIGIPGSCAPRQPVGGPCGADGDCSTYLCDTRVTPNVCAELDVQTAYCGLR